MPARIVVAIDGPAGAGKSTASKRLAKELGYVLLDTGAIYRSIACRANQLGVALDDEARLAELARALPIEFVFDGEVNRVLLDGQDVSSAIRTAEMSQAASRVSALPKVRGALLGLQRQLGEKGG